MPVNPNLRYTPPGIPVLPDTSASFVNVANLLGSASEGATSVLDRYAQRQTEDADNALLAEISQYPDAVSLQEAFGKGLLSNHPKASEDAIEYALGYGSDLANLNAQQISNRRSSFDLNRAQLSAERADSQRAVLTNPDIQRLFDLYEQQARTSGGPVIRRKDFNERNLLAFMLQAEAGNNPDEQLAVGATALNRFYSGRFGDSLGATLLQPGQFSPFNSLTGYANGEQGQEIDFSRITPETYAVADRLLAGNYVDPTNGATHFYRGADAGFNVPVWANDTFRQLNGLHYFGRTEELQNLPARNFTQQYNPQTYSFETTVDARQNLNKALVDSNVFTRQEIDNLLRDTDNRSEETNNLLFDQEVQRREAEVQNRLSVSPDASQTQTAINSIDNALFAYPVANTVRIQEAGEATGLTPEQLLIQETTPDEDGTIFPFSLAVTPVNRSEMLKLLKDLHGENPDIDPYTIVSAIIANYQDNPSGINRLSNNVDIKGIDEYLTPFKTSLSREEYFAIENNSLKDKNLLIQLDVSIEADKLRLERDSNFLTEEEKRILRTQISSKETQRKDVLERLKQYTRQLGNRNTEENTKENKEEN